MSALPSREQRIYLALWRKAYRDRETSNLSITCSNFKMAMRQRLGLYRVIKPYRSGEAFDTELSAAAEALVPTISKPGIEPVTLTFRPRQDLSELESLVSELGLDPMDFLTSEEKIAQAEIDALVSDPSPRHEPNPFYSRD